MFSKELENLIQATIADGQLSEKEKNVLIKRAKNENVDLDELEIYIDSLLQHRRQEKSAQIEKETVAHEKLREGNVCPHCHTVIPSMTKICPNPDCKRTINVNETSGDKELQELIDHISMALIKVKSADDIDGFRKAKAECSVLLTKANLFYGEIREIQLLRKEVNDEIEDVEKKIKSISRKKSTSKSFKTTLNSFKSILNSFKNSAYFGCLFFLFIFFIFIILGAFLICLISWL